MILVTFSGHQYNNLQITYKLSRKGLQPYKPMNQVDTEAIYQGYKLASPQNAQELDEWMLANLSYRGAYH